MHMKWLKYFYCVFLGKLRFYKTVKEKIASLKLDDQNETPIILTFKFFFCFVYLLSIENNHIQSQSCFQKANFILKIN